MAVWGADGAWVGTIGAGEGAGEGQLKQPVSVAVDGGGLVLVGEWGNARVSVFREEEGEGGRHAFVRCLGGADAFGRGAYLGLGLDAATGAIAVYSDEKKTAWVQAGPGAPLALPAAAGTAS